MILKMLNIVQSTGWRARYRCYLYEGIVPNLVIYLNWTSISKWLAICWHSKSFYYFQWKWCVSLASLRFLCLWFFCWPLTWWIIFFRHFAHFIESFSNSRLLFVSHMCLYCLAYFYFFLSFIAFMTPTTNIHTLTNLLATISWN
jgi:hypothetical protein